MFSNVVVSVKFEFSMKNYNKKVPSDFFLTSRTRGKPPQSFDTSNKADTFVSLSDARSAIFSCVAPFERQNTNLETSYEG